MSLRYLSVCSGIEAASEAVRPLGWHDASGKPQADGPRYRQIGNSWPVPVAAWICDRLDRTLREGRA